MRYTDPSTHEVYRYRRRERILFCVRICLYMYVQICFQNYTGLMGDHCNGDISASRRPVSASMPEPCARYGATSRTLISVTQDMLCYSCQLSAGSLGRQHEKGLLSCGSRIESATPLAVRTLVSVMRHSVCSFASGSHIDFRFFKAQQVRMFRRCSSLVQRCPQARDHMASNVIMTQGNRFQDYFGLALKDLKAQNFFLAPQTLDLHFRQSRATRG